MPFPTCVAATMAHTVLASSILSSLQIVMDSSGRDYLCRWSGQHGRASWPCALCMVVPQIKASPHS